MRTLITGSNCFLGAHLAARFSSEKHLVRCLVRRGSDASALASLEVEKVEGDVTQPATLRPALEGVEVVFHLAGVRRATTRDQFLEVNTEGTRAVCEAMKQ